MQEHTCTYDGHDRSVIYGICVNKNCNKLRSVCLVCTRQYHNQHVRDLLNFDEFKMWRVRSQPFQHQLITTIETLSDAAKTLRKLFKEDRFNLESATTTEIGDEVARVLQMKSANILLSKDFSELNEHIKLIQKKLKLMKKGINQTTVSNQRIILQQQTQIQQPIQVEEPVLAQVVHKPEFTFYSQHLPEPIKVYQSKKLVEYPLGSNGFLSCKPAIPHTGVTRATFKIIQIGLSVLIGVCQRSFSCQLLEIGHGSYLISNSGYSFSHHEKTMNDEEKAFSFKTGDVITVEVDIVNKKITWIKMQATYGATPFHLILNEMYFLWLDLMKVSVYLGKYFNHQQVDQL